MTPSKLITCILDKSAKSFDLLRDLKEEQNIHRSNVLSARGTGTGAKGGLITMPQEKHIVQIVVHKDRAEEIFEWLYEKVELDTRYGAFMFQEELTIAGTFTLPEASQDEQ